MVAAKRVSVTIQMLWPSATTNNGGLAAAKLITKLGKISRNGNIDNQSFVLPQTPVSDGYAILLLDSGFDVHMEPYVVRNVELPPLRYGSNNIFLTPVDWI